MKLFDYNRLKVFFSVVIISFLITLPTLINQHWSLLDDALVLRMAKILENTWLVPAEDTGRYRPIYWLYYALQYKFFGTEVSGYYFVQAIVLILSNLFLYASVRLLTKSNSISWISVITFVTSSSLAENYYTLTKQEPRLVLLFLMSLYFYLRAEPTVHHFFSNSTKNFVNWINSCGWLTASSVSLLFAYLTKETAVIVLLASILWVLINFYLEKRENPKIKTTLAIGYLILNFLSFLISTVAAYGYKRTTAPWAGKYTSSMFSVTFSFEDVLSYATVNLDVFILTFFLVIGLTILVFFKPHLYDKTVAYTLFFTVCSVGYLSLFTFFWPHKLAYYALPISAWNAIAIALLTKTLISAIQPSQWRKVFNLLIVTVLLFSRFYSIPTLYNVAVAHKAWDKVNGQMLEKIAKLPNQSQVLLNFPKKFQYLLDTHLLLKFLYKRSDINLGSLLEDQDLWQNHKNKVLLVNFGSETNHNVAVRAMHPPLLKHFQDWISPINGLELKQIFLTQSNHNIVLPFSFQSLPFTLGWVGYQVVKLPELFLNKDADGWIGKEVDLLIAPQSIKEKIAISGESFLPTEISYPIHLDVGNKSLKIKRFTIKEAGKFKFTLNLSTLENSQPKDGKYFKLKIIADKTFIPAKHNINDDPRELSVLINNIGFSK